MQRIAIFTTADGDEVAIQVDDDELLSGLAGDDVTDAGADGALPGLTVRGIPDGALSTRGIPTGRLVERTQQSLDDVLAHARPAVSALLRQVREQEDAPDELEVEFGVQVSLEVGAYIAAASSSGELPRHHAVAEPPGRSAGHGRGDGAGDRARPGNGLLRRARPAVGRGRRAVPDDQLDLDELVDRRPLLEATVLASSVSARRVMSDTEAVVQESWRRLFESTFSGGSAPRTVRAWRSPPSGARACRSPCGSQRRASPPCRGRPSSMRRLVHYLCRKEPLVRHVPAPHSPRPSRSNPRCGCSA